MRASSDHLSATFSALADPTRRAILSTLAQRGETSVTDLAAPFDMSLPGFSKHIKVLEKAGLIARGRTAQWRPCKLEAEPLREIADWVEHYRRHWEQSFDRLEVYLRELQAGEKPGTRPKRRTNAGSGKKASPARRRKAGRQARDKDTAVQTSGRKKRGDKKR